MSTRTPTQAEYEKADHVHEVADTFAQSLPGFPRSVSTSASTLPELVDGRPTWDVTVEALDETAAAKIRVTEGADGELAAELVERYTHSIGTADDIGDDYVAGLAAAERAAVERSNRRHETVVIWDLAHSLSPVAFAFNGQLYRPAEVAR